MSDDKILDNQSEKTEELDQSIENPTAQEQAPAAAETCQEAPETVKVQNVAHHKFVEKEPIIRVVKKDKNSFLSGMAVRLFAIGTAFLIIMIFLQQVSDMSMTQVWGYIKEGTVSVDISADDFVKNSFLLLCVALALAPAFKMRFWNIGAQGQILMGGLLTAVVMKYFVNLDSPTMIFVMFVFALLAGGMWALIPAFFKVKLNANETLFTLMMNYVAIQLVACCVDIWKGKNSGLPQFNADTKLGWVPSVGSEVNGLIIILVVVLTVLMFFYMRNTKQGYEISIVGESINTARYAGINTSKVILRTMFMSGAICGICGFLYVGVADHSISSSMSGSYGFTAIIIAWAAHFNPIGMLCLSFLMTFISLGTGNVVNYVPNLNDSVSEITVGIFLFLLIGCEFFINYRLVFNSKITNKINDIKGKIYATAPGFFDKLKAFNDNVKQKTARVNDTVQNTLTMASDAVSSAFSRIALSISSAIKKDKAATAVADNNQSGEVNE